jgi:predicted metalloendopeptidase
MMVDYLLKGFKERVNQMDWLSDFSKQRSIEKVEAMTSQAAYPAQIFDNDYVNGLYSRVSKD